ncbi:hypothetical protein QBC44DRAFT_357307 [Cladorrhinum sp. PSN332]|nr:hypothetical protein QBC44DRAFT_357307 [Cladorrhinum sp. PSN332]
MMLLLRSLLGLIPRLPPNNTIPNSSVGEEYPHARMGLNRCWQAVGPARQMFEALSGRISLILADWEAPDDDFVGWSIFMVGLSEETATPTLIVHGENASARKSVCKLVQDSGLLQQYRVRLDDRRYAPDFNRVDPLQFLSGSTTPATSERQVRCRVPFQHLQGSTILINSNDGSVSKATVGIVFQHNGTVFVTTVAHAFPPLPESGKKAISFTIVSSLGVALGNPIMFRAIDYALIEVLASKEHISTPSIPTLTDLISRVSSKPRDTQISGSLSSNQLSGSLSGTPTFIRMPGTKGFHEVWTIRSARPLVEGDCGSMAVDPLDGQIYGHVVAGSRTSNNAYILPAKQLLQLTLLHFQASVRPHHAARSGCSSFLGTLSRWDLLGISYPRTTVACPKSGGELPYFNYLARSTNRCLGTLKLVLLVSIMTFFLSRYLTQCQGNLPIKSTHEKSIHLALGNCSRTGSGADTAQSWGIRLLGNDAGNICLSPSTVTDSTFLHQLDLCAELGEGCRSRRGGLIRPPNTGSHPPSWTLPLQLNPSFDNRTIAVYLANDTVQMYNDNPTDQNFNSELGQNLGTFGNSYTAPHLGVGRQSSFLSALYEVGNISARKFGLDVGSQLDPVYRQGTLVLGGFDSAYPEEALARFPLPDTTTTRQQDACQLPLRVRASYLRGGSSSKDLEILHDTPACIEPYDYLFRLPQHQLDMIRNLVSFLTFASGWPSNEDKCEGNSFQLSQGLLIPNEPEVRSAFDDLSLDFTFTMGSGKNFTVQIPGSRLLRPLRCISYHGKMTINPSFMELAIHRTSTNTGHLILGQAFLSQLYLSVDYDSGEFSLTALNGANGSVATGPHEIKATLAHIMLSTMSLLLPLVSLLLYILSRPVRYKKVLETPIPLLDWLGSPQSALTKACWSAAQPMLDSRQNGRFKHSQLGNYGRSPATRTKTMELGWRTNNPRKERLVRKLIWLQHVTRLSKSRQDMGDFNIQPQSPITSRHQVNQLPRPVNLYGLSTLGGLAATSVSFLFSLMVELVTNQTGRPVTYLALNMLTAWYSLLTCLELSKLGYLPDGSDLSMNAGLIPSPGGGLNSLNSLNSRQDVLAPDPKLPHILQYLAAILSASFVSICTLAAAVTGLPTSNESTSGNDIWASGLLIYGLLGTGTWLILISGRTGRWLNNLAAMLKISALVTLLVLGFFHLSPAQPTRTASRQFEPDVISQSWDRQSQIKNHSHGAFFETWTSNLLSSSKFNSYDHPHQIHSSFDALRHHYLELGFGIFLVVQFKILFLLWLFRNTRWSAFKQQQTFGLDVAEEGLIKQAHWSLAEATGREGDGGITEKATCEGRTHGKGGGKNKVEIGREGDGGITKQGKGGGSNEVETGTGGQNELELVSQ